jgi:hypothetical protein
MKNAKTLLLVDQDDLLNLLRRVLAEREQAKPSRQLWTAKEAAEALRLSESKIRQIGADHPEVIVRIGKAVRFDPDRLREVISKGRK